MALLDRRIQLDEIFRSIAGADHVYFQPPSNVQMTYPAILYKTRIINSRYADNFPFLVGTQYEVIVIDKNPDSVIAEEVAKLPRCSSNRFYTADNLNHWVFTIY